MRTIKGLLVSAAGTQGLSRQQQAAAARELIRTAGLAVYEASVSQAEGALLALARDGRARRLVVVAEPGGMPNDRVGLCGNKEPRASARAAARPPAGPGIVHGHLAFGPLIRDRHRIDVDNTALELGTLPVGHEAACGLRQLLAWTAPQVVGLRRSVGLGDRLGLATPGHLRAVQGSGCVPFPAQQSIREMTRTRRTPEQVMDDATWGVFQAGWREGFGSDADHLKEPADIDATDAAGFTMFTIDPGDHVRSDADTMGGASLSSGTDALPWAELETSAADFRKAYLGRSFALDGGETVTFNQETLARAAIKYGSAIVHTVRMFRHLKDRRGSRPFELEVSVDETATPTTVPEHYLIAAELKRLGVEWVSLAPRFTGEFEKGIDYKGDLGAFEESYVQHIAIARTLGPYKLSLHSGSDKFSVYPIAARLSGELVHLKTAGTSYLEALRVAARKRPGLFRRILQFAFERFDEDKASYHISARIAAVPHPHALQDRELETVLDGNDGRQLLHVTYGSVLTWENDDGTYKFRDELLEMLIDDEEEHYTVLAEHLGKHVQPFAR